MIRLKRGAEPALFKSKAMQVFRKQLSDFYTKNTRANKQRKAEWMSDELVMKVLRELGRSHEEKCAYCERALEPEQLTFDHFRPAKSAKGFGGEYSEKHYWWLAGKWQNMLLSCSDCNSAKSTWFPVKGRRAPVKSTVTLLKKEKALLIDPFTEDPSVHLTYQDDGTMIALSEKGAATLEILQLNRKTLVEQRRDIVKGTDILIKELKELADNRGKFAEKLLGVVVLLRDIYWDKFLDGPFIGFQRYYYMRYFTDLQTRHLLFESKEGYSRSIRSVQVQLEHLYHFYGSRDKQKRFVTPAKPSKAEGRIYMENIKITNFKGIEHLSIDFPQSTQPIKKGQLASEPMLMLLGENGVGKSSILQAILLGLAGQSYINRLKLEPQELIFTNNKKGTTVDKAEIVIQFRGERRPILVTISKTKIKSELVSSGWHVLGYGAGRMPKTRRLMPETGRTNIRAENLFYHDTSLIDYNEWLCSLPLIDFNRVAKALKELMMLDVKDRITRDTKLKRVYKLDRRKKVSIESLSDGYRSVFAVACDIMEKLVKEKTNIDVAEGVVLIDEIGTHLHPRWRMQVVGRLRTVFPKVQFIVTTHDPLCLKGTKKGEVLVLNKEPGTDAIKVLKDLPDPSPMRADQLLASEFFGLSTTIDENAEELYNEYYYLLGLQMQRQLTNAELVKLQSLEKQVDEVSVSGNSQRERIMNQAIDRSIVKNKFTEEKATRVQIEEDTINELAELLSNENTAV